MPRGTTSLPTIHQYQSQSPTKLLNTANNHIVVRKLRKNNHIRHQKVEWYTTYFSTVLSTPEREWLPSLPFTTSPWWWSGKFSRGLQPPRSVIQVWHSIFDYLQAFYTEFIQNLYNKMCSFYFKCIYRPSSARILCQNIQLSSGSIAGLGKTGWEYRRDQGRGSEERKWGCTHWHRNLSTRDVPLFKMGRLSRPTFLSMQFCRK